MIISRDSTEHGASQWSHSGHTWKLGSTYVIYRLPNLKVTTPPPGSTKGNLGNGFCTSFYVRSQYGYAKTLFVTRTVYALNTFWYGEGPSRSQTTVYDQSPSTFTFCWQVDSVQCGPQTLSVSFELQRWKESTEDRINHYYGTRDRSVLRRYLQDR